MYTYLLKIAHAQCTGFCNPLTYTTLSGFLYAILNTVIIFLFPVVVLMIVYTGFLFVQAQGNPEKINKARQALLWTVIGGLIVLGGFAIAQMLEATVASVTP
jgi:hypothetical protein